MSILRLASLLGALSLAALLLWPGATPADIDAPPATPGRMCQWSTHIIQVRVAQVDRNKGIVAWRKTAELEGKWPGGDKSARLQAHPPKEIRARGKEKTRRNLLSRRALC